MVTAKIKPKKNIINLWMITSRHYNKKVISKGPTIKRKKSEKEVRKNRPSFSDWHFYQIKLMIHYFLCLNLPSKKNRFFMILFCKEFQTIKPSVVAFQLLKDFPKLILNSPKMLNFVGMAVMS